jgi:predicted RNA-binding Zn-ribbon protein involved in translation (DUF1610 family)
MPAADNTQDSGRRKQLIVLGVVLVALVGSVSYTVIRSQRYNPKIRPNSPFRLVTTWRCLACGHTLEDNAAVGPRECPACGADQMYVSIKHACPTHGVFPVAFQYTEDGNPIEVKVADGPWVPRLTEEGGINIRCPECGAILLPAEQPQRPSTRRPGSGD